jgi:predicted nucleotidyltransferase
MRPASPDTDAVLAEIVRRLIAEFQPERIYLFGSRARGDAGPDSDYDLLMSEDHDLAEIGQQCAVLDRSLESLCRRAEGLTTFAWIFRYPGEPEEPPVEDAFGALALAREVYQAVISRRPGEVRP